MSEPIRPGLLVRDRYDRLGIVRDRAKRPSESWLRDQERPISDEHASGAWWTVLPLTGGAVLSPEPLLTPLRQATYEDFLQAVESANQAGVKSLAALFPDYAQTALRTNRNSR
jgi:hypothetical protein